VGVVGHARVEKIPGEAWIELMLLMCSQFRLTIVFGYCRRLPRTLCCSAYLALVRMLYVCLSALKVTDRSGGGPWSRLAAVGDVLAAFVDPWSVMTLLYRGAWRRQKLSVL